MTAPATLARGAELYARHCALCHGTTGDGLGPASRFLEPPARDFGVGRFSLVSTRNGVPTDADLVRTLRRGMPGSAMPAWDWMGEADLLQLAHYVRHLGTVRLTATLMRTSSQFGEGMKPDVARALAVQRLQPGPEIEPPAKQPVSAETLAVGQRLYVENCAACHGLDGKGRRPVMQEGEGHDVRLARDFTAGILKGGGSHDELAWRIVAGMPGSGMPGTRFENDGDTVAVVAFVRSLLPPANTDRLVQHRQTLRAARLSGGVPSDPGDARWQQALENRVVLAPLSWHEDAIFVAHLTAVHDGETLAVRIRWADASRDDSNLMARHTDGAALQFSLAAEPPILAMGSGTEQINLWHWRAFAPDATAGALDLLDELPRGRDSYGDERRSDVPIHGEPPAVPARAMAPSGFATLATAMRTQRPVDAKANWVDGEWQVVFTRTLRGRDASELSLAAGGTAQIGAAVWNGAAGDRRSRKSITIWHGLQLDP